MSHQGYSGSPEVTFWIKWVVFICSSEIIESLISLAFSVENILNIVCTYTNSNSFTILFLRLVFMKNLWPLYKRCEVKTSSIKSVIKNKKVDLGAKHIQKQTSSKLFFVWGEPPFTCSISCCLCRYCCFCCSRICCWCCCCCCCFSAAAAAAWLLRYAALPWLLDMAFDPDWAAMPLFPGTDVMALPGPGPCGGAG